MKNNDPVSQFYKSFPLDSRYKDKDVLIDYKKEFRFLDAGLNFHWWGETPATTHHHNYYEFFYVVEGSTDHLINGTESTLQCGSLTMIKVGDTHAFFPIKNSRLLHLTLGVTPEKLKILCTALSTDLYEYIIQSPSVTINLSNAEQSQIMNLAQKMDYTVDSTSNHSLEKIVVTQTLIYILFLFYQNKTTKKQLLPAWFTDLLEKMNSPEYLCASIPELAQLVNYSPKSLVSYFRKYTGNTIIAYQNKLKVNYACKLLTTTNKTTLNIASDLMYNSLTAFNCMFKKYTGMTPKEYRFSSRQNPGNNKTN